MREVHGLERLVHLRHLDLSNTWMKVLPKSIGKLKELRYLDLSNTQVERLPQSITSLSHLQTLNLSECWYLRKLPDGIHGMGSLRHLDVSGCESLKKLPDGIGRLTLLQTLGRFPVAREGGEKGGRSNIGELGGLNRLRGHLSITNLGAVGSEEEARTAKLQDKASLVDIQLSWDFGESQLPAMDVLEGLRPPPQLERLRIVDYPGRAFPSWMGDAAFLLLNCVELVNCENCTQLPPLGQLPCLRSLSIDGLSGVKRVGEEFLHLGLGLGLGDDKVRTSIVAFPQLEYLRFWGMNSWEQWAPPLSSSPSSSEVKVNKADADAIILPRLSKLEIGDCPKLEGVPPIFTTALQSLQLVRVSTGKLLADSAPTFLPALNHLEIEDDSELTADQLNPTLLHLTTLQSLLLSGCTNLRTLPEGLTRLTNLRGLEIYECTPELSESCQVGGLLWPMISHIPRIRIDFREVQNNAC